MVFSRGASNISVHRTQYRQNYICECAVVWISRLPGGLLDSDHHKVSTLCHRIRYSGNSTWAKCLAGETFRSWCVEPVNWGGNKPAVLKHNPNRHSKCHNNFLGNSVWRCSVVRLGAGAALVKWCGVQLGRRTIRQRSFVLHFWPTIF